MDPLMDRRVQKFFGGLPGIDLDAVLPEMGHSKRLFPAESAFLKMDFFRQRHGQASRYLRKQEGPGVVILPSAQRILPFWTVPNRSG